MIQKLAKGLRLVGASLALPRPSHTDQPELAERGGGLFGEVTEQRSPAAKSYRRCGFGESLARLSGQAKPEGRSDLGQSRALRKCISKPETTIAFVRRATLVRILSRAERGMCLLSIRERAGFSP